MDGIIPSGLSFSRLIENADPVVQAVMLALATASALCWTIFIEKILRYAAFSVELRRATSIAGAEAGDYPSWLASRFQLLTQDEAPDAGESRGAFQERLERILGMETASQLSRLQAGLPILATVGSTAPFVGLFGTVWGIMNSFTSIAAAKDTSLAVVAPGIAEALLATAIGLAAAIPAVIFYNLAIVFLSSCAERMSMVASRYARGLAYETGRQNPAPRAGDEQDHRKAQVRGNGGIDAR